MTSLRLLGQKTSFLAFLGLRCPKAVGPPARPLGTVELHHVICHVIPSTFTPGRRVSEPSSFTATTAQTAEDKDDIWDVKYGFLKRALTMNIEHLKRSEFRISSISKPFLIHCALR